MKKRLRDFIYRFRPLPDYYGNEFKKIFAFLNESRNWDRKRLQEYKLIRLKELVSHAERNVPFYREWFKEHGIKSGDIRSLEDFSEIPILTKRIVQEHYDELKADNIELYGPIPAETSGTSGGSTKFFRSAHLEAFRKAVLWRFYHEHGFGFREKRAVLTNPHNYEPDAPVSEYNPLENELVIDTAHMVARRFRPVLDDLLKFKPKLLWSHPNMLGLLAEYILENDLEPLEIPIIGTYGMKFHPALRQMVHKVVTGRYIEYYGNRENTIAAWGESDGLFYEVSEYCHFELQNDPVRDKPGYGDLIATSLHNYAFPLIRYHSEDYIEYLGYANSDVPCPAIRLIGGRGKDLLVTRKGLIEPYLVNYMSKKGFTKIRSYQIEQTGLDDIILRVAVKTDYDHDRDEEELLRLAAESLPVRMNIKVEYVENIPVTPAGKFQLVISPLAFEYLKQY